ncbi:L-glyceraldehyde 3-phosphate reductase [Lacinutrix mariniflava]|uniref:L-glyceraldehyde 3-phosphate reductase n=1 Tax=Lacinutrix mariniflava TaxID=342955 RepID=UPI0006E1C584|nr:L-glyceraldehyde 3-phosphate reductase [Lacinutrix mariniflava]
MSDKSKSKNYKALEDRYDKMIYKRCGNSGVLLPAISLGLWHNFGFVDDIKNARDILKCAFDLGITHYDLANNYGPPYGSAEKNFGKIFKKDFKPYRDELFISTKAGYDMWPGPYGNWGSRKYLISSLDQSLKRMKLDYVDVFYHHRPDPNTPLEETMGALADIVRQGKALYVGISNYKPEETVKASKLLKDLKVPFIVNQVRYSILDRWVEDGLLEALKQEALGCIAFSPLAQGMLTDKYINGVPPNSRAAKESRHLDINKVNATINKVKALNTIAEARGQKLSQMAISWLLNKPEITSVLIGASSTNQLKENVKALDNINFSVEEMTKIKAINKG